jgi:hypothetical protein
VFALEHPPLAVATDLRVTVVSASPRDETAILTSEATTLCTSPHVLPGMFFLADGTEMHDPVAILGG